MKFSGPRLWSKTQPQRVSGALRLLRPDNSAASGFWRMTIALSATTLSDMGAAEIIKELPKLAEADRRAIRQVLLEIANQDPEVALCNPSAMEGAMTLDRMEDDDARGQSQ